MLFKSLTIAFKAFHSLAQEYEVFSRQGKKVAPAKVRKPCVVCT